MTTSPDPCDAGLPAQRVHLPFEAGPHRMTMGLLAVPEAAWFEIDARYPDDMAERRRLLAERHGEVFAALPVSDSARREALVMVAANLTTAVPEWFRREDHLLRNRLTGEGWDLAAPPCDSLELAGRLVQEDLCLIQPADGGPVLTAAVLCFPSRWRLHEKIGRTLAAVHGPVPLYADALAAPVDRFMARIGAGHIVVRRNWSVVDDPALFQPEGHGRGDLNAAITPDNAGTTLFLRVERQTLRRLPETGAVLFGIRVHVYPLAVAVRDTAAASRLAAALRALPADLARYKSLLTFRAALLTWLDRRGT